MSVLLAPKPEPILSEPPSDILEHGPHSQVWDPGPSCGCWALFCLLTRCPGRLPGSGLVLASHSASSPQTAVLQTAFSCYFPSPWKRDPFFLPKELWSLYLSIMWTVWSFLEAVPESSHPVCFFHLPSAPGETWWLILLEVLPQWWVLLCPASLPLCILTYLGLGRDWSIFSLLSKHKDPRQSLPLAPYSQLSQPVLLGKRVLCCLVEPSFRLDHLNYCLAVPRCWHSQKP